MLHQDAILQNIAQALLVDYSGIFFVNACTGAFRFLSDHPVLGCLPLRKSGNDFFTDFIADTGRFVYEPDREAFIESFRKETLLPHILENTMQPVNFRLKAEEKPLYFSVILLRGIRTEDDCFVLGIMDETNMNRKKDAAQKASEENAVFKLIAETLAAHYDVLYYINVNDGHYTEYTAKNIYGNLQMQEDGEDFFSDAQNNSEKLLHPRDRERVLAVLRQDYLIHALEDRKKHSIDYRLMIGGQPRHTRLTSMWASDRVHLIIGVENIDTEIRKEKERAKALRIAEKQAQQDGLTGIKNKIAYQEFCESVQNRLDGGAEYLPFALVVCDINDLDETNDAHGRLAGDEMLRAASRLICNVFTHSPVFRVGSDEFVVFLSTSDYQNRDALFQRLHDQVLQNRRQKDGPIVASGMSVFVPTVDHRISEVFLRAENHMFEEKARLKSGYYDEPDNRNAMPEEEKHKLDILFHALELIAEDSYVFLCNMKYNYSRWSRAAVSVFNLPGEYMYNAGEIWAKYIHPEDREIYINGMNDIFTGNASGHDMQYRAKRPNGAYDVCTCRGTVLREPDGTPEWFCGAIRDHGIQGRMDTLTGLRNQYGFFEDLQSYMQKHSDIRVCMIVISKFSEINEVYGYQFGNTILQRFGRYLFEQIGNSGNVYRLDGTKFAVLSRILTPEDLNIRYQDLREHFRKGFFINNEFLILDLSAGLLNVEHFDIDYQTVYACLNFAYSESKLRHQGDLVEFYDEINAGNKHRLEKLYVIRASVRQNYKGFYLLYQPVVDAETEQLIGAEALLRWRSEEYGMVPPDHFIPILEKDPLFCELGEWILRTAINGAKLIMEDHPDFVINVNLSYSQLEKPDFVDMVLRTLKEESFPPEHLCLEITERCRLLDMYLLKNVIVNLRGHGIKIALDDFGTGFSSIGLVKNLPFDTIKIDRSFVLKIEEDEKERSLIQTFSTMASTFGAKVCVEGIETSGMRDILQQFNIQSFQGYYYGKPLELREFLLYQPYADNSGKS